jgi:glycosyltransferase involved in cell wall biosynthesis
MTDPKISVITVVHNGAATVEDTIYSVAAQDYPRIEHIIIDGASTDGTLDIVRRHREKFAAFRSEPDRGMYDAMNKGLSMATGDIIGFLNADDAYVDNTILKQVAELFSDDTVDACYADLIYVDKDNPEKVVRYWRSRPYESGLFERGWMPAHPTFFVRRGVYEKYGGYDLDYRLQSDFELTMRFMAINNIRSIYSPKIFVRMRMGGESNKNLANIVKGNLEAFRACRKHGLKIGPFFVVKKLLSRLPQFFRRPTVI